MPRPYQDSQGNIVDPKTLRKLWMILLGSRFAFDPEKYLTRHGGWSEDRHQAAAWHEHEKALAEDAAASIILSAPGEYFGRVSVVSALG